ncbi:hypothetical protein GP486_002260 [Trichoglossum hirsutum]|uniref:PUA domain-containing protein n=1 Tax=Trichoglossum hirsutum TaxID=265104 RepID=A0A9P8LF37_9PEZI|nr:hypothetical protein GP486_002260 [Trichoglossum hirsutum]
MFVESDGCVLTRRKRTQYLNAKNTLDELLHMGVIPIVNENDTLAVAEIKFGDNDTLSAITAAMVQADYLFLMTDVDCLYDKNPRTNPDAKAIKVVDNIALLEADAGSSLGTGGMSTKIVAARLATSAGVTTVITRSSNPGNVANIVKHTQAQRTSQPATPPSETIPKPGEDDPPRSPSSLHLDVPSSPPLHTRFNPDPKPMRDRYFWILHGLAPCGTVYIDEGAFSALVGKAGLLPVGIVDVEGAFAQQEAVRLVVVKRLPATNPSTDGYEKTKPPPVEVGRAIVNYSAVEMMRIKGVKSTEIEHVLGYADSEYVALRENIALSK